MTYPCPKYLLLTAKSTAWISNYITIEYWGMWIRINVQYACFWWHYDDVIMSAIASQITSLTIVYSTVYPGADQSKHESSASLAFVWGSHRGPVNSPHKWPVTRKMFPFDDVIMKVFKCARFDIISLWQVTKVMLTRTPLLTEINWD